MTRVALTIAGSDPSGGAGLQADLKTFHRFGVYGEAVATLITVQNTRGVTRVDTLAPDLVSAQIQAVLDDIPPHAAKTVLVKGGPLKGDALDLLYLAGGEIHESRAARIDPPHTHGSGCTYSAAITAELAKGTPLADAVACAKTFITEAIRTAPRLGS